MKAEKSCGAVVLWRNDDKTQVLLIKHVNGGHWAFPKGHVEKDETEEQTALREIMEETGISVKLDTGYRKVVTYSPLKDVIKDVVYFLAFAEDKNTSAQIEEISRIKWVDIQDSYSYITYTNDKEVLSGAIEYYKNKYGIN